MSLDKLPESELESLHDRAQKIGGKFPEKLSELVATNPTSIRIGSFRELAGMDRNVEDAKRRMPRHLKSNEDCFCLRLKYSTQVEEAPPNRDSMMDWYEDEQIEYYTCYYLAYIPNKVRDEGESVINSVEAATKET